MRRTKAGFSRAALRAPNLTLIYKWGNTWELYPNTFPDSNRLGSSQAFGEPAGYDRYPKLEIS